MNTIRCDAIHRAEPAQRCLRSWRGCRAPVPSVFPSGASPEGKMEVRFKPWLVQSFQTGLSGTPAAPARSCPPRPEPRSPRAFDTIGIHLKTALGLSNEVGPPQWDWAARLSFVVAGHPDTVLKKQEIA